MSELGSYNLTILPRKVKPIPYPVDQMATLEVNYLYENYTKRQRNKESENSRSIITNHNALLERLLDSKSNIAIDRRVL